MTPLTKEQTVAIVFPEMFDEVLNRIVKVDTCNQAFHTVPERSADLRLLALVRYLENLQAGFHHSDALNKAEYDTLKN